MRYSNEILRIVPFERVKHMTDEYRSWFHDPEVTKYNSHGLFPYSPGAMEAFVKTIEQGSDSKIVWAIEVLDESSSSDVYKEFAYRMEHKHLPIDALFKHIGNCSLDRINWINRSAELTIVLGRERGKGYGLQACEWMLEHAFYKLGLNRVWTGTASLNHAMQRTALKIGMRQEGVFHQAMLLNGEYVNIVMYGILRWMFDEAMPGVLKGRE